MLRQTLGTLKKPLLDSAGGSVSFGVARLFDLQDPAERSSVRKHDRSHSFWFPVVSFLVYR